MITILFMILPTVFAGADRGIGGGARRSIVVASMLLLAGGLGLLGQGLAAILIATWLIYRTIPWSVGGTITPRGAAQIIGALARHAGPCLAIVGGNVWFGTPPQAAIPLAAYAVFATGLAVWYAHHVDNLAARGLGETGEANDILELIRGLSFGLAAATATLLHNAT